MSDAEEQIVFKNETLKAPYTVSVHLSALWVSLCVLLIS